MIIEKSDTIAAISTPMGVGGIGVIRISGPEAASIAGKIFTPTRITADKKETLLTENPSDPFSPRRMYHGHISAPDQKGFLDEVLLVFMPKPKSYTGDDVVEIQAHAGTVVLRSILEQVLIAGARMAEPGEFTKRAYLNGRIDLSQAEAVIDIIQAKTESSLKIATRQLEGAVGNAAKKIKERILNIQAMIEAEIEFPDDIEDDVQSEELYQNWMHEIQASLEGLLEGYRSGHLIREGLRLAIIGKANVGKSSLLNRFLRKDRAIVTDFPGTTRDSIEETLNMSGLPVVLIDTAGWRDTTDPVERIGIERTREMAESADLVLFMVEAEKGFLEEDHALYGKIQGKEKILVINKKDLVKGNPVIDIPKGWHFFATLYTSVKFDQGIEDLKKQIYRFGTEDGADCEGGIVPNLRQNKLLERAHQDISAAQEGLKQNLPKELIAIDLRGAMDALDEITGESVKADVMDVVFSRFCIGK